MIRVQHGIYYAYWEHEWCGDYLHYVKKAAELGFDIIELAAAPVAEYSLKQIEELKSCAEEQGIRITLGFGPPAKYNPSSSDQEVVKSGLEFYRRLFTAMESLGSNLIGGALYSYWPVDYTRPIDKAGDWKRSVKTVREMGKMAADHGITLGMEVLNRFENYLLNTAEEGVLFVGEVGCSNVKVMLDTFHMNIEEESIGGAIRRAGKLLGHFHTGECNRMVPGKGRMPWREIGEALRDIGYDGAVVMEPFVQMGGTVGSDIKVWRDISKGASQKQLDKDAKAALEFQRYMLG